MKINSNFDNLVPNYLFAEVAKRTNDFISNNPDKKVIKLGIGDVTLPLPPVAVEAMKQGAEELGKKETFKGYPDYEGYEFVRKAVSDYYKSYGVSVAPEEILINDGAKSDSGNIGDIFSQDNTVLVTDPVYPVYVDSNIMAGRKIIYAAVIIYDAAYEAFITEDNCPRSIFAIDGARTCAIELCSLSKTAGFTGTRCGYTVIPKELERDGHNIYKLWYRREATKFNGVSWPVQRAAAAVFSEEGQRQIKENLAYYQENARIIASAMDELGIYYTGGKNSPYIWLKCPNGMGSWEFFDFLLEKANVVGTPGEGFGKNGEGYFRLTSFGDRENTIEAVERIKKVISNI